MTITGITLNANGLWGIPQLTPVLQIVVEKHQIVLTTVATILLGCKLMKNMTYSLGAEVTFKNYYTLEK